MYFSYANIKGANQQRRNRKINYLVSCTNRNITICFSALEKSEIESKMQSPRECIK